MKKTIVLILLMVLFLCFAGCNGNAVTIDFPFEVRDVKNVELYHYAGASASAETKVVTAESDISSLYRMFEDLSLKDEQIAETAGAEVTGFRFNLSDGTNYELIYVCNGVKNGILQSETGNFSYFTSADIGAYWNLLHTESEAAPVRESERPQ